MAVCLGFGPSGLRRVWVRLDRHAMAQVGRRDRDRGRLRRSRGLRPRRTVRDAAAGPDWQICSAFAVVGNAAAHQPM
jgi:hypothetical protein